MRWNATTSQDRTNFAESFTSSESNLNWARRLESRPRATRFVAKKDLDSEMTVVRNDGARRERALPRPMQRVDGAAYQWHAYSRSTIGARSDGGKRAHPEPAGGSPALVPPDNAGWPSRSVDRNQGRLAKVAGALWRHCQSPRPAAPEYTVELAQDGERRVTVPRRRTANLR